MVNLENLDIRVIEKSDKKEIFEFIKLLNNTENLEISISEEEIDYIINKDEFKNGVFMVYYGEKLIGFGNCLHSGTTDNEGNIQVTIHPDYREIGVENKLYEILINIAEEKNYKKLTSNANKDMKYLINFYEEKGYKEFEYLWKMKMSLKNKSKEQISIKGIEFIEAKKQDITKLTDLMNDGFREGKEDKFKVDTFENKFLDPTNYVCFLKKDGELIATSNIQIQENLSMGYISNLAVYKKYRGKGYGKLLLNLSIEKIIEAGLETATLHVVGTNESALNLYKKAGFREYDTLIKYEKEL